MSGLQTKSLNAFIKNLINQKITVITVDNKGIYGLLMQYFDNDALVILENRSETSIPTAPDTLLHVIPLKSIIRIVIPQKP